MDALHVKLLPGDAELEISFFDLDGKVRACACGRGCCHAYADTYMYMYKRADGPCVRACVLLCIYGGT